MQSKYVRIVVFLSILLFSIGYSSLAAAEKRAIQLDITGAISPSSQDFILRGLEYAQRHEDEIVILRLDTPGGLDASMRGVVKAILASPIPVITYVAPEGARAASAGTFILYASHIAAMAPGTNLGAASPVEIGGSSKMPSIMEKKVKNDASAYIRSLAQLRGRNADWAEKAVREAVSIPADEALKLKVIDLIAPNVTELLNQVNGHTVIVQGAAKTLQTKNLQIEIVKPDWRYQFLSIITDPSVAYILLLIGIYGLFFEFYNPGLVVPGVVGAISLLIALYAFQLLPINYAGFGLLILGVVFMVIEVMVSSFGVIGIGGVIAFILGSVFLLDTNEPGFNIAWQVILVMSFVSAAFFFIVINLAIRSMNKKVVTGQEALIGKIGEVLECKEDECLARILGEIWKVRSQHVLHKGEKVRVTHVSGLILTVEPVKSFQEDS